MLDDFVKEDLNSLCQKPRVSKSNEVKIVSPIAAAFTSYFVCLDLAVSAALQPLIFPCACVAVLRIGNELEQCIGKHSKLNIEIICSLTISI
jgi:hypothetical protein